VTSLAFSLDGVSLVSGSNNKTLKLWDVQTGGVVKTFCGHTNNVCSISISPGCSTIASGSWDHTIRLWDVQTGKSYCTIEQEGYVNYVRFSPKDAQHLMSSSGGSIWRWDTNGHQIEPVYYGSCLEFSPDGTHFVSCGKKVTVRNFKSGVTVAEFPAPTNGVNHCCFSPNGRSIAIATGTTAYIWDISTSDPHLIETLTGHTDQITSLAFSSSSLISVSLDQSVKFWQIGASSTNPIAISDPKSVPLTSAPIKSVTLQAKDNIVISSDSDGVVRVWDLSIGHQKCSFQTPAKGKINTRQIDGRLVVVWYDWKIGAPGRVYVWDAEKGELLQTFGECWSRVLDLKISGDGSKVFLLDHQSIQAWLLLTGKHVGKVVFTEQQPDSLIVDGSRVWLSGSDPIRWWLTGANPIGWDFGTLGSPQDLLPNTFPNIPCLSFLNETGQDQTGRSWIEDTVTGRPILYLPGRFSDIPTKTNLQWDDRYLVAGHSSGEVSILDFNYIYLK